MDLVGTPNLQQPPSTTIQKKAVIKCEECRRKKIKCFPEWRSWEHGQKCTPCVHSNLPCGPSVRKQHDAGSPPVSTVPATYAPSPSTIPMSSLSNRMSSFQQDASEDLNNWFPTPYPSFAAGAGSPQATSSFNDTSVTMQNWTAMQLEKAHSELSTMGSLFDVFSYLQGRRTMINKTRSILPLIKTEDLVTALDMLALVVGNSFLNSFRKVKELCSSLNGADKEIILYRLVTIGSLYHVSARLTKASDQTERSNSLSEEHDLALKDLLTVYEQRGDSSQVERLKLLLHQTLFTPGSFKGDQDMVITRTERISAALCKLLRDLRDVSSRYRDVLAPKGKLAVPPHAFAIYENCDSSVYTSESLGSLQGVDITCRNALHVAVEVSNLDAIKWILAQPDAKTLLQSRDSLGLTPLHIAAYTGNLDIFDTLETNGADLRTRDESGRDVLCIAAMAGCMSIAKRLLSLGLSPRDSIKFCSPLHDAAAAGHMKMAQLLLDNKAEPRLEHLSHGGRSPSQTATDHGHHMLAHLLKDAELASDSQSPMEQITLEDLKQKVEGALARSRSPESELISQAVSWAHRSLSKRERDSSECSSSPRRRSKLKKDRSLSQPPQTSRNREQNTVSGRTLSQPNSAGSTTDDPICIPDVMFESDMSTVSDQFDEFSTQIQDILQESAFDNDLWHTS